MGCVVGQTAALLGCSGPDRTLYVMVDRRVDRRLEAGYRHAALSNSRVSSLVGTHRSIRRVRPRKP